MKVIIEVKNGMVTGVYSDNCELAVDILDYDNYNDADCDSDMKRYYKAVEEEKKILDYILY